MMYDAAVSLDKHPSLPHSAPNGPLTNYQSRLTEKLQAILLRLDNTSKSIAAEANQDLTKRMNIFLENKQKLCARRDELVATMGTSDIDYDVLRKVLDSINDELIQSCISVRLESVEIYDAAFQRMQPVIDDAFAECQDWRGQLPAHLSNRLEYEVTRLNKQYIQTKKTLVENFFRCEQETRNSVDKANAIFDENSDAWKDHRFQTVVEGAKQWFSLSNGIDLSDIYADFQRDQDKFTQCCEKNMQNVQLISPPDHFQQANLDKWWNEVLEVLELHGNFIRAFLAKIKKRIDERKQRNEELIETVKKQLSELKDEETVSNQIAWLLPLRNLVEKYNEKFFTKLTKYWENRDLALNAAFTSVKNFLQELMDTYREFIISSEKDENDVKNDVDRLDEEMRQRVMKREEQIRLKVEEVNGAVKEKDIHQGVESCKQLLDEIAEEYRNFYIKSIERLDQRKPFVMSLYEAQESKLLELLKMNKASVMQESAPRTAKGKSAPRTAKRSSKRERLSLTPLTFGFTLADGSKYEESDQLSVIPPTEEFVDENEEQEAVAGKKGKKPPAKKPAKGKKGKVDEPEELEVPELRLFDFVPKMQNGKPIIWVYIPESSELAGYANPLRKAIISSLNSRYSHIIVEAEYEDWRLDLSEQLQERMRVHAPRIPQMDLNVAEARTYQLESRKNFMEKHFRQTTINFNKEFLQLKSGLEKRKESLHIEAENLHQFVDKLQVEKVSKGFGDLVLAYRTSEKNFKAHLQKVVNDMYNDISTVMGTFQGTNDRFMASVESQDPPFSNEEKSLCATYLERMNTQISTLTTELTDLTKSAECEAEEICDRISKEYENDSPHHKMDVEFIEALNGYQNDARAKYESLLFKNRQSENDVNTALDRIKRTQGEDIDAQEKINRLFEVMDVFRLLVIRRAKYIGIMKSDIPSEAMSIVIDLMSQVNSETMGSDAKRRGSTRSKKTIRQPTHSGKQDKGPPLDFNGTLRAQIDSIGADMIHNVTNTSTEYYKKVKARKFAITRAEIKPDQKACIQFMKEQWAHIIADSADVVQTAGEHLTLQVMESIKIVRESVRVMFDCVDTHYRQAILESRSELMTTFETEIQAYNKKRIEIRKRLTPQLADVNRLDDLKSIVREEQARELEESNLIASFHSSMIECENQAMKNFVGHLPLVVKGALSFFDQFVMGDDLVNGPVENAKRLTMMQMLKDQSRRQNGSEPFDDKRPFRHRAWPQLNAVMGNMESVLTEVNKAPSQPTSRRGKRPAGTKQKQRSEVEYIPEKTMQQNSLDTGLNRGVIVEQNACYEKYERELNDRLADFKVEMQNIRDRVKSQNENWRRCVLSLKPDWVFPPV